MTRFASTLQPLWDSSLVLLSLVLAILWDVLARLLGYVGDLVYVKPIFGIGIILLILVDLVVGYRAARRKGEARTTKLFTKTFDKLLTRSALLVAVAVFTNMFVGDALYGAASDVILKTTFFLVALAEVKSILRNITGDEERVERLFKGVVHVILKRDISLLLKEDLDAPAKSERTR